MKRAIVGDLPDILFTRKVEVEEPDHCDTLARDVVPNHQGLNKNLPVIS